MRAGAALRDITPPSGLRMAGFGVRTLPAEGAHDPLTARALVIEDTALVVLDVIGVDAATSRRIRAGCVLPDERVVVAALHTHGGPVSMPARMHAPWSAEYLERLEAQAIAAIDAAAAAARPAELLLGNGADPGIGRNRRHPEGPVDAALPVLSVRGLDGNWIAALVSYACHPVVVGAANRLWTADYPHFARLTIEAGLPGALAIFATGCAGDVNTGHSAAASATLVPSEKRSFAEAGRIGERIGRAALEAPLTIVPPGVVDAAECRLHLALAPIETEPPEELARRWRAERETADPALRPVLDAWIGWAERTAGAALAPVPARVAALRWGAVPLVSLPGEIFAATALELRRTLGEAAFVLSYCEDDPGYIAPVAEYAEPGYEIGEAHRYYDLPAPFAPGGAEALREAALACLASLGFGGRA